ncbi:MAG: ABC transporter ATP-binding protein [Ruminococcus sp.]|nr:ABC transporter ATP-binding protein [Ruminococcus sp.]
MKKNALDWLWKTAGRKKLMILSLAAVEAVHGASGVLYALFLRNIVDSAQAHSKKGFALWCILTALLVASQLLMRAFLRYMSENARSSLENIYKGRLIKCLLRKDYAAVSAVHSGEWMNRLTNDTQVIANAMTDIVPGVSGMVIKLVSAAVMMAAMDMRFLLVMLPCGGAMLVITYIMRRKLKALHRNIQQKDGAFRIFMQERMSSMMMIRSFSAEDLTETEADAKMQDHRIARMKRNSLSNAANVGFGLAMQGMYVFGVCYCGYGILKGRLTFGTLTAITQLISQIQQPFANMTSYLPRYYAMTASAERLMEAEDFTDDIPDGKALTLDEASDFYNNELDALGLSDVSFTYYPAVSDTSDLDKEKNPIAISNITFEVKKGEYAAFTGHSGCGKSTSLKLLMCVFVPDSGERFAVTKDGRHITLGPKWHRLFAYVPQGNMLMSGTIRDIVSFSDGAAANDDERIDNALKIACADEFVAALENGIDTLLGERGAGLSEGQMQRIAIARAVFSQSPVLLLDEATSALDDETERRVLENLRSMTDKTVLIVTHRPAALDICDKVFEMKGSSVTVRKGGAT